MTQLVTLDEVKTGLRVDSSDDDALLGLLLSAASEAVIAHLKDQAAVLFDLDAAQGNSPQDAGVPDLVKQATILLTGYLYRNPDGDAGKAFERGNLPMPVTALLYPLRDPQLR